MGVDHPPVVSMRDVLGHGGSRVQAEYRYITSRCIGKDLEVSSVAVGSGLSGNVFHARRRVGGGQCAVKSFIKGILNKEETRDLKHEVEIYLTLDHPRIARLEAVYETKSRVHVVMEYLTGGDLADRLLEQSRFTERAARHVTRQILQAICYLHSRGVVHRDVKLENVVYASEDTDDIKLIDFGLSSRWDGIRSLKRACGTITYAAPEVFQHCYTSKADVWSVGVICYALLTGTMPFDGNVKEPSTTILQGLPWTSAFQCLSPNARAFIKLLMSPDTSVRPNADVALQHKWLVSHPERHAPLNRDMLSSLQLFASTSRPQRTQMLIEAWHAPSNLTAQGRAQYLTLCDGEPALTSDRFTSEVVSYFGMRRDEAERLFDALDDDCSGLVSYTRFLAAAFSAQASPDSDHIFASFDVGRYSSCPAVVDCGLRESKSALHSDPVSSSTVSSCFRGLFRAVCMCDCALHSASRSEQRVARGQHGTLRHHHRAGLSTDGLETADVSVY